MAYVRCTVPGEAPRVTSLIKDVTVLGRSQQCDIPLASDNNCSRRHFQIRKWAGKWVVEDLGSHNGTYVNGAKVVKEHPLADGDLISAGDTTVLFKI
jgi:pSer/pThr/pTyr-binding forkhead associated (FHA) protein